MESLLTRLRLMPPRRLGLTWILGLAAEALIVLTVLVTTDRPENPPLPLFADSVFADPAEPTPLVGEVVRDSAFQSMLIDSLGMTIRTQGDLTTIRTRGGTVAVFDSAGPTAVRLGPEAKASLSTMVEGLNESIDALVLRMVGTLAVLAAIPLALVSLTVAWFWARHRGSGLAPASE